MRGRHRPRSRVCFRHDEQLGGYAVGVEGRFAGHSPAALERAITDERMRARWLQLPVSAEPAEPVEPSQPVPAHGGEYAMRLGSDEVRIRLDPGARELGLHHVFHGAEPWRNGLAAARCAAAWEACYGRLATLLDGGSPRRPRLPVSRALAMTSGFAQHRGTPHLTLAGELIRFDRDLLGLSREYVWSVLHDGVAPTANAAGFPFRAGTVTELVEGRVLEFEAAHDRGPAGSVRWELHETPGYGAWIRLDHLVDVRSRPAAFAFMAAWHLHLLVLMRRMHGLAPGAGPVEGTELTALTERYQQWFPDHFAEFWTP
ncbi:hypothetical protein [Sciscionella marina]|uniref:hypothetical protein n=1 Tax=Sciscionella marina TaxID=508770 RepID=UPI0012F63130|nr:hypothetical protein [Sciscionella marina]